MKAKKSPPGPSARRAATEPAAPIRKLAAATACAALLIVALFSARKAGTAPVAAAAPVAVAPVAADDASNLWPPKNDASNLWPPKKNDASNLWPAKNDASNLRPAKNDASSLWRVERANAVACEDYTKRIEKIFTMPPGTRDIVKMEDQPGMFKAGLGNEFNTVTHAALIALALNRPLCAHERLLNASTIMPLLSSPALDAARDPRRAESCRNMSRVSRRFDKLQAHETMERREGVAVISYGFNWTPMSLKNPVTQKLAAQFPDRDSYETAVACVHHALFRPGPVVRAAAEPRLKELRSGESLGLHVRTGDMHMAQYQQYKGTRKLALDTEIRNGCLAPLEFAKRIRNSSCGATNVFVGSDNTVRKKHWDLGGAVVVTKGRPTHTGRRVGENATHVGGALKALVDFFLLTETDVFASNCDYRCSGGLCGNTFAFNVHYHRAPAFATRERYSHKKYACSALLR